MVQIYGLYKLFLKQILIDDTIMVTSTYNIKYGFTNITYDTGSMAIVSGGILLVNITMQDLITNSYFES